MDEVREITIVPADSPAPAGYANGTKGFFTPAVVAPTKLKTDVLRNNLADFVGALNEALKGIPDLLEGFKLDEIEVVVEVSGEGSIQMLGGLKVGASGGITLKLKR